MWLVVIKWSSLRCNGINLLFLPAGDSIAMGNPKGSFDCNRLQGVSEAILIAAGSGMLTLWIITWLFQFYMCISSFLLFDFSFDRFYSNGINPQSFFTLSVRRWKQSINQEKSAPHFCKQNTKGYNMEERIGQFSQREQEVTLS